MESCSLNFSYYFTFLNYHKIKASCFSCSLVFNDFSVCIPQILFLLDARVRMFPAQLGFCCRFTLFTSPSIFCQLVGARLVGFAEGLWRLFLDQGFARERS